MRSSASSSSGADPSGWPGERLGFPRFGRGSVATPLRRIFALLIDFAACFVIYLGFFFGNDWASLVLFAGEQIIFLALTGSGFGHFVMGIRLVTVRGAHPNIFRIILRTVLLILLLPALVWDSDQRGLHDVFAGTVLIHRR